MRPLTRMMAVLLAALSAHGASAQAPLTPYTKPQQLVALPDGRHINLVCEGRGSPTVILMAGAGSWAATWSRVQPLVAKQTRACAWDQPGYGFSDASAQPQTSDSMAADLKAALNAGGIAGPYLLVAHSAGGFDALQFTERNRAQVAGLVLVDPTLPNIFTRVGAISPLAANLLRADITGRANAFRRCAANVAQVAAADAAICFYMPEHARPLSEVLQTREHEAARMADRASVYEQLEANTRVSPAAQTLGDMPLTILTSEKGPLAVLPVEQPARGAALAKLWNDGHDEMAALSRRGSNHVVPGSTHLIQHDKPEAVAEAITAMVSGLRAN